jgi:DNA-binding transcriptional MocR family regulator
MSDFGTLRPDELRQLRAELTAHTEEFRARKLNIDMTRGKPSSEQLDLSLGMLECVDGKHFRSPSGVDCRNYGGVDGIPEAKVLFSQYLEVAPEEIIVGGNSSLNMMYDAVVRAMMHGVVDSPIPWGKLPDVTFLCPSPGYDRHFAICQHLGIALIPVEMGPDGPSVDQVEELVANEASPQTAKLDS